MLWCNITSRIPTICEITKGMVCYYSGFFVYCFVYFQVKVKLELCDPEDQFFVDDDNEVQTVPI